MTPAGLAKRVVPVVSRRIRYNLGLFVLGYCRDFAMLIVLSPAKSLDYETPPRLKTHTLPRFIDRSATLIERCASWRRRMWAR